MEIIILALIAAVVLYKLYKVLGDNKFDSQRPPVLSKIPDGKKQAVRELKSVSPPTPEDLKALDSANEKKYGKDLWENIKAVQQINRAFNPDLFTSGAHDAFETIIKAYARGDVEKLETLLSKTMLATLQAEIVKRKSRGEEHETTLIAVVSCEMKTIQYDKKNIQITVRFVTDQVNLVKDTHGKVIEGDPSHIDRVVDIWTFEHALHGSDPNWLLVKVAVE